MATELQPIPVYGGVSPNKDTQTQEVFDGAADAYISYEYNEFVPSLNVFAADMNVLSSEIEVVRDETVQAAANAAASANQKGVFVPSTSTANLGETWQYPQGVYWVCNADGTTSTPADNLAQWSRGVVSGVLKISSVFDSQFSSLQAGQLIDLVGYHDGSNVGGGLGVVKLARHNGGTAISTSRVRPSDWTDQTQLVDWVADSAVDELCVVRTGFADITFDMFGAKNGENIDVLMSKFISLGGFFKASHKYEYILSDNFVINVNENMFDFNYSVLTDTGSSGYLFTFEGTTASPYEQQYTVFENVEITSTRTAGRHALSFDDTVSVGDGPSHTIYKNVNVNGFDYGHNYGSRGYLLTFANCSIWNCQTAIVSLNTTFDGGENIRWFGGSIYNNTTLAISFNNPNGMINFNATSLDYNFKVADVVSGVINFNMCHIEAGDYIDTPFTVGSSGSSDGAAVNILGGWVLETSPLPHSHAYFVNCGLGCFFTMKDVKLNNTRSASGKFSTGRGRVRVYNITTYDSHQNDFTLGHLQSKYYDPIYNGIISPQTHITEDTAPISSQLVGTNIILERSTNYAFNGTHSLKYTKAFGSGSLSSFNLAKIAVNQGDNIGFSFVYLRPAAAAGDVVLSYKWVTEMYNKPTDDTIIVETVIGETVISSSTGAAWQEIQGQNTTNLAPPGTTHFVITVSGFGWAANGESMYFDQIDVSSMG